MTIKILKKHKLPFKRVEMPHLYEDINILLADLVGWKHINFKNKTVKVSLDGKKYRKFNFKNKKVIFPIADFFNLKAEKNGDGWLCKYMSVGGKEMLSISKSRKLALALGIIAQESVKEITTLSNS